MKRPPTISSKQRRQLRALAHHLDPLVHVGDKGLTEGVLDAVDRALTDHELIKIRVQPDCPLDRKKLGPELADKVDAHDVGVVGRIVILYRRHPEQPRVPLKA